MLAVSAITFTKEESSTDGSASKSLLGEEMTLCQRISHMYSMFIPGRSYAGIQWHAHQKIVLGSPSTVAMMTDATICSYA